MFGPMLQTLLEDRFHLRLHRETIEGPVYELTAPKGASKLQAFDPSACVQPSLTYPPPDLPKGQRYCRAAIFMQPPSVQGEGATIAEFLAMVNMVVDRPVIDKTGLTGRYTMRVEFVVDESTPGMRGMGGRTPATDAADPKPDIFQAVEQQLGLKLTPARGPTERIVIDHVEKPTGN